MVKTDNRVMLVQRRKVWKDEYQPKIRVAGSWIKEFGFLPNTLFTVKYDYGCLVLEVQGSGKDTYLKLSKQAINKQFDISQVKEHLANKRLTANFQVSSPLLANMGFEIGTLIIIEPKPNVITIRRLEIEATTLTRSYRYD